MSYEAKGFEERFEDRLKSFHLSLPQLKLDQQYDYFL
jgi:hypothetical protein